MTWATPCDGKKECINGSDEAGCETPIWIVPLILFGVGCLLVITLFLYSFNNIYEAARSISYDQVVTNNTTKNKSLHIAILTEKKDLKMIEQLIINEVNIKGNKGEAICSFKVFFFLYYTYKYTFCQSEK